MTETASARERADRAATMPQADAYLVERIREALAHDARVAELGISVAVVGEKVLLTGEVATPERRAAVTEVAIPLLGGRQLHNGLTVTAISESPEPEVLE